MGLTKNHLIGVVVFVVLEVLLAIAMKGVLS